MKLFLIRHGETEHNIAGLLAGVTDSKLTNHGVLQGERLGEYLIGNLDLRFTALFASDLRRAYETAEKISKAQIQSVPSTTNVDVVRLPLLREQDFGSFELVPWSRAQANFENLPNPSDPEFVPKETNEAMRARADKFLDDYLSPLLAVDFEQESCVAVVSHGLFLAALWKTLLARFGPQSVSLEPNASLPRPGQPLELLPAWSNTGYLQLQIDVIERPESDADSSVIAANINSEGCVSLYLFAKLSIKTVNGKDHLLKLKRTGGGVGSATHDDKQQRLDGFFKKPKPNDLK